jgi:hypothetical protein
MTAHASYQETKQGTILMPVIQGTDMPEKISGMMNLIAYMEVNEESDGYICRLHARLTDEHYGKDQYDALTEMDGAMENPSMPKLLALIEKQIGKAPTAARGRGQSTASPTRRGAPVRRGGSK